MNDCSYASLNGGQTWVETVLPIPAGFPIMGDGAPAARPNVRDPLDETLITCP